LFDAFQWLTSESKCELLGHHHKLSYGHRRDQLNLVFRHIYSLLTEPANLNRRSLFWNRDLVVLFIDFHGTVHKYHYNSLRFIQYRHVAEPANFNRRSLLWNRDFVDLFIYFLWAIHKYYYHLLRFIQYRHCAAAYWLFFFWNRSWSVLSFWNQPWFAIFFYCDTTLGQQYHRFATYVGYRHYPAAHRLSFFFGNSSWLIAYFQPATIWE
jgi:hypothetical protein